jgi:DNA-directed RNA polymerase specialized sigma24 family protein
MFSLRNPIAAVLPLRPQSDRLLKPFLSARTAAESDRALTALCSRAERTIERASRRYLPSPSEAGDREDAAAEAMLQLTRALVRLRDEPDASPIRAFDAVVGRIARNSCWKIVQARYPRRRIIRQGILDALSTAGDLCVWSAPGGVEVCGLTIWRGSPDRAPQPLYALQDALDRALNAALDHPTDDAGGDLAAVLRELIAKAGAPAPLSSIVSAFAEHCGVAGDTVSIDSLADSEAPRASDADAFDAVAHRRSLLLVWKAILDLSPTQRAALLLNFSLCDDGLYSFVDNGVAGIRDIAAALDMTPDAFAVLWNELPLPNKRIALHLAKVRGKAVTERNVIQFRDDARAALAKRLRRDDWWARSETEPAASDKAGAG